MKYITTVLIFILVCVSFADAQENNPIATLNHQYESFLYTKVVSTADSLLKNPGNFTDGQLIQIYRIKGISEYSLLDENSARKSFLEILNIDSTYKLDSTVTSPKIISFYNNIKKKYLNDIVKKKSFETCGDSLSAKSNFANINRAAEKLRNSMIRSLVLPGTGHLYLGKKAKGIILTSLSAVSLGSMIYFIINTNKKHDAYESETNPSLIPGKYNDYNSSYKMRNASILTFAVLWIYSQVDILFFTDFNQNGDISENRLPGLKYDSQKGFQVSYKFQF